MPQLIRPGETTVVTKDGEVKVHITLELVINVNGNTEISAQAKESRDLEEDIEWIVPDFSSDKFIK